MMVSLHTIIKLFQTVLKRPKSGHLKTWKPYYYYFEHREFNSDSVSCKICFCCEIMNFLLNVKTDCFFIVLIAENSKMARNPDWQKNGWFLDYFFNFFFAKVPNCPEIRIRCNYRLFTHSFSILLQKFKLARNPYFLFLVLIV